MNNKHLILSNLNLNLLDFKECDVLTGIFYEFAQLYKELPNMKFLFQIYQKS